jgi:hypothetical protein
MTTTDTDKSLAERLDRLEAQQAQDAADRERVHERQSRLPDVPSYDSPAKEFTQPIAAAQNAARLQRVQAARERHERRQKAEERRRPELNALTAGERAARAAFGDAERAFGEAEARFGAELAEICRERAWLTQEIDADADRPAGGMVALLKAAMGSMKIFARRRAVLHRARRQGLVAGHSCRAASPVRAVQPQVEAAPLRGMKLRI